MRALAWLLQTLGMLGEWYAPVVRPGDYAPRPGVPLLDAPPPGHPERLSPDVRPSPAECLLWMELDLDGVSPPPDPQRRPR